MPDIPFYLFKCDGSRLRPHLSDIKEARSFAARVALESGKPVEICTIRPTMEPLVIQTITPDEARDMRDKEGV